MCVKGDEYCAKRKEVKLNVRQRKDKWLKIFKKSAFISISSPCTLHTWLIRYSTQLKLNKKLLLFRFLKVKKRVNVYSLSQKYLKFEAA